MRSILRKRSGLGQVEILPVIAIIGILVALLLPSVQAVRHLAEEGDVGAQWCLFITKILAFFAMMFCTAVIGEDSARYIRLGSHQWARKRVFGIRKGWLDRILYGVGGSALSVALLWCFGVRPPAMLPNSFAELLSPTEASWGFYMIQVVAMCFLIITAHVVYRAHKRIQRVGGYAFYPPYRAMFHPHMLTVELRANAWRQEYMKRLDDLEVQD